MKISERELMIAMSGNYMSEYLPEDYQEMDDKTLYDFISDHAWEPLQYNPPEQTYEYIENAVYTITKFLQEKGIEVTI